MDCNVIRYFVVVALALLASGCGNGTLVVSGDTVQCTRALHGNCLDWMTRDAVTVMLTPAYQLCSVLFEDHAGRQVSFEGGALERYVDDDNWQCRTPDAPGGPGRIVRMHNALMTVGSVSPKPATADHNADFQRTDTYYGMLRHILLSERPDPAPL